MEEFYSDGSDARWERGKQIGKGGFASVYFATKNPSFTSPNLFLPSKFAIKSADIDDYSGVSSLEIEAEILTLLQPSPFIIGCYGTDVTMGFYKSHKFLNLLLEYASHGSLSDRIRKTKLHEIEIVHHTQQILKGICHIHSKGFVHCDLKPDNVLLVPSDDSPIGVSPKIADFGLASHPIEPNECGVMKGTAMYMAPESLGRSEYSFKSDVWALGCIVLEMITAKKPWKWDVYESVQKLCDHILYSRTLPQIPVNISEEARDFLRHCLVFDPEDRWSVDMLLRHPFVATDIDDTHSSSRVASPTNLFDSITSCSSCVTEDNKTSQVQNQRTVIHILSSGEGKALGLHHEKRAKRRKLCN